MAKGIGPVKLTRADQKILKSYIPTLQGLAAYLGSSYEIVLHSLGRLRSLCDRHHQRRAHRAAGSVPPSPILLWICWTSSLRAGKGLHGVFQPDKKGEPLKSTTIAVRGEYDRITLSASICI